MCTATTGATRVAAASPTRKTPLTSPPTGPILVSCPYSDSALGSPSPSKSPEDLCHYVVVRADLPRGLQAAQVVHAAGESSPGNLPSGTHAVVLTVPGSVEMEALARRLAQAGVAHVRIEEPDPPWDGALLAIGLVPGRKEAFRRHLSSLPLLR